MHDIVDVSNIGRWAVMPGRRQLPTRSELRIWREFVETTEVLRTLLAARLQTESALSPGDYAVLLALRETEGHRMRPSEMAMHIGWERSRLSHHLGRMERRRPIRRQEGATHSPCADNRPEPAA